jgi:hypothetical protein
MRLRTLLFCTALGAAALFADSAAGLKWTAPAGWANKGAAPMRAATYTVQDAECVAYFFGQGQGGSIEANLDRWKGQFSVNGQPPKANVSKKTVHGLNVTEMDVTGTYTGAAGPMMAPQPPKPDTRMLAAIVEGPGGNIFLKFTGPAKTIAANQAKFEQLVASFEKE